MSSCLNPAATFYRCSWSYGCELFLVNPCITRYATHLFNTKERELTMRSLLTDIVVVPHPSYNYICKSSRSTVHWILSFLPNSCDICGFKVDELVFPESTASSHDRYSGIMSHLTMQRAVQGAYLLIVRPKRAPMRHRLVAIVGQSHRSVHIPNHEPPPQKQRT